MIENPFVEVLAPPAKPENTSRWTDGTITSVSPILVRLDGYMESPQPPTKPPLVGGISIDDRVLCMIHGRQLLIVGKYGGNSGGGAPELPASVPTANLVYKKHSSGYYYEVMTIRCGGSPRPNVLRKVYASDFNLTSGTGDSFICSEDKKETIQSMVSRMGADAGTNCSGWQTAVGATENMVRGVQIKDGVIYRDFEPSSNRGRHALGVRYDGSIHSYRVEDGDSAASMVAGGVVDTIGFGPLLIRNGVNQDVESLSWSASITSPSVVSARTIVGAKSNHDIVIITVVGKSSTGIGVGGNNMVALAASEGCYNAILLDGGGSTQGVVSGLTTHPSSDDSGKRLLPDALLVYARITQTPNSVLTMPPEPILLDSNVAYDPGVYQPAVSVVAGQAHVTGQLLPASGGNWPSGSWIDIGRMPDKARPRITGGGLFFQSSLAGTVGSSRVQIRANGNISIYLDTAAVAVNISNITYTVM